MGRPPIEDQPRTGVTRLRQTPQEKAQWQRFADAQSQSLTEFVREAVQRHIRWLQKTKK